MGSSSVEGDSGRVYFILSCRNNVACECGMMTLKRIFGKIRGMVIVTDIEIMI